MLPVPADKLIVLHRIPGGRCRLTLRRGSSRHTRCLFHFRDKGNQRPEKNRVISHFPLTILAYMLIFPA